MVGNWILCHIGLSIVTITQMMSGSIVTNSLYSFQSLDHGCTDSE